MKGYHGKGSKNAGSRSENKNTRPVHTHRIPHTFGENAGSVQKNKGGKKGRKGY